METKDNKQLKENELDEVSGGGRTLELHTDIESVLKGAACGVEFGQALSGKATKLRIDESTAATEDILRIK